MQAVVAGRLLGPQNVVGLQQHKGSGREIVNGVQILRLNGGNKSFFVSGGLRLARASSSEESRRHRILAFSEEGLSAEEDLVTTEGTVPEEQTEIIPQGPTVKVKFELHKECHYGQQFNVVGADPQLGDWEPSFALPLNWTEGHVWTTEVDLPEGKKIEYKYILISDSNGVAEWQPGPNHVLETVPGHNSLLVSEPWEKPPQPEMTTNDSMIEPADEVEVEVSEDEKISVANDEEEEVSSPLDVVADAAASATVGALNASVKAATALEGGIAATPLRNILSKESNENEVAEDEEGIPTATAVEIPVIDAALAATAEEVRGESKETEETISNVASTAVEIPAVDATLSAIAEEVRGESKEMEETTSNDASTAVEIPVIDAALATTAEEVRGESKETEEMTSNDASTAIEFPVIDAALAPTPEEVRGESKETEETTSNDAPTAVEIPVNHAALAATAEEVGDNGAPSASSTGEEEEEEEDLNQLMPVNPFQKDIEWLTKILFGSN